MSDLHTALTYKHVSQCGTKSCYARYLYEVSEARRFNSHQHLQQTACQPHAS